MTWHEVLRTLLCDWAGWEPRLASLSSSLRTWNSTIVVWWMYNRLLWVCQCWPDIIQDIAATTDDHPPSKVTRLQCWRDEKLCWRMSADCVIQGLNTCWQLTQFNIKNTFKNLHWTQSSFLISICAQGGGAAYNDPPSLNKSIVVTLTSYRAPNPSFVQLVC